MGLAASCLKTPTLPLEQISAGTARRAAQQTAHEKYQIAVRARLRQAYARLLDTYSQRIAQKLLATLADVEADGVWHPVPLWSCSFHSGVDCAHLDHPSDAELQNVFADAKAKLEAVDPRLVWDRVGSSAA